MWISTTIRLAGAMIDPFLVFCLEGGGEAGGWSNAMLSERGP